MTTPLLPFDLLVKNITRESDVNRLKKLIKLDYDLDQFQDRILNDIEVNNRKFYFAIFDVFEDLVEKGFMKRAPLKSRRTVHSRELCRYKASSSYLEAFKPKFIQKYVPSSLGKIAEQESRILVQTKYLQLMTSASSRMMDFDLTPSYVKKLLDRKTCFFTNIPFEDTPESPYRRTIDRVDSNLGYVKGNVVPCCYFINQLKNELLETGTGYQLETKQIKQALDIFSSIVQSKEEKSLYKDIVHHLETLKKRKATLHSLAKRFQITIEALTLIVKKSESSLVKVSDDGLYFYLEPNKVTLDQK